jgi:hypothetical protein
VRRLAIADQPGHIAHRDRRLLYQQLPGGSHSPRQQVLTKGCLSKLSVSARHLPWRAGKRARHALQRQRVAIVTSDRRARQQIQATALVEC